MKFQEYAHHLFDAIRRGRILMGMATDERERLARGRLAEWLPVVERLPLYVLRDPVNETFDDGLFEIASERLRQGRIRLPFDRMLFQFTMTDLVDPDDPDRVPPNDIWIVLATTEASMGWNDAYQALYDRIGRGDGDAFWVRLFATAVTELDNWFQVNCVARVSHGRIHVYQIDESPLAPEREKILSDNLIDAGGLVCGTLVMMDSPSIEIEHVKVPREINRGRRLMKRPQVPDHTVLRLPKVVYARDGEGRGGTHRRPRPHWRRPHDREYKPGKFTHIPLTLVARREGEPPPPPVVELIARKEPTR